MKRRTQGALLVGSLAVAMAVATVAVLAGALTQRLDPHHHCATGFSTLTSCTYHWSATSSGRSSPIITTPSSSTSSIQPSSDEPLRFDHVSSTSWAVARCPQNYIAKRLLCAGAPQAAPAASDDLVTGLPLPKPWFSRTAMHSRLIKSFHLETPLDLAAVLGFYRAELSKRGWIENDGAVVEPDRAVIAFTTTDGPALLRLIHQDDRTIADLSMRKPAAANVGILPTPGRVRLMLGNHTNEKAVITVNEQTVTLAARAGENLKEAADAKRKSPDSPEIDLPPGKYKVALKLASGAVQNRVFEVAADETWGLLVGPDGVALPVRLY